MVDRFIRFVVLGLVRLFYRRVELLGREHLPATGPAVFVANHSNGLLDPLLVTASTGRATQFLAASFCFATRFSGASCAPLVRCPFTASASANLAAAYRKTFWQLGRAACLAVNHAQDLHDGRPAARSALADSLI